MILLERGIVSTLRVRQLPGTRKGLDWSVPTCWGITAYYNVENTRQSSFGRELVMPSKKTLKVKEIVSAYRCQMVPSV